MLILHAFVLAVTLLLAVPVLWFCTQVFAACAKPGRTKFEFNSSEVANIAVLIPAHNESVNLIPTLRCVFQQNLPNLRVLLVADNCSDDTAQLGERAGAEVGLHTDDSVTDSRLFLRSAALAVRAGMTPEGAGPEVGQGDEPDEEGERDEGR